MKVFTLTVLSVLGLFTQSALALFPCQSALDRVDLALMHNPAPEIETMLSREDLSEIIAAYYSPNQYFSEKEWSRVTSQQHKQQILDKWIVLLTAPVWLPMMGLTALANRIALKPDTPILFFQWRLGRNGKRFQIFKFRTMTEENGVMRNTNIGYLLRRWKLDELPQLINILRGEMTLVGPRPIVFNDKNIDASLSSLYPFRLFVLPGLTSLHAVNIDPKSPYNTYTKDRLEYDLTEINRASLKQYFHTILKTIFVIATGNVRTNAPRP